VIFDRICKEVSRWFGSTNERRVWLCGIQLVVSVLLFWKQLSWISLLLLVLPISYPQQVQSRKNKVYSIIPFLQTHDQPSNSLPSVYFTEQGGGDACTYPILSGPRPRSSHSLHLERADLQHLSETTQVNAKIPTNHIKAPCTTRTNVVPDTRVTDQTPAAHRTEQQRICTRNNRGSTAVVE
jgi:hypothetical protein